MCTHTHIHTHFHIKTGRRSVWHNNEKSSVLLRRLCSQFSGVPLLAPGEGGSTSSPPSAAFDSPVIENSISICSVALEHNCFSSNLRPRLSIAGAHLCQNWPAPARSLSYICLTPGGYLQVRDPSVISTELTSKKQGAAFCYRWSDLQAAEQSGQKSLETDFALCDLLLASTAAVKIMGSEVDIDLQ